MTNQCDKTTTKGHAISAGIAGGAAIAGATLGLSVLFGWYTRNTALIQLHPTFVPMQYNTALGFLLCGLALLGAVIRVPRLAAMGGWMAAALGLLTLIEYIFGANLGIDEWLMKHYIAVETSHPGRMAPNTALCFLLTGAALALGGQSRQSRRIDAVVAGLGALVLTLGAVAFFGYLIGINTAYGWDNLTSMAVHTAAGFIVLGMGVVTFAWHQAHVSGRRWPFTWAAGPAAFAMWTIAVVMWQALRIAETNVIERETAVAKALVQKEVASWIKSRNLALVRMAERWETAGAPDRAAWKMDAANYVAHYEGYQAIAWVGPGYRVRWVAPLEGNEAVQDLVLTFEGKRAAALEEGKNNRTMITTRPVELTEVVNGLFTFVPIYEDDNFGGFILGVFRSKSLLGAILDDENIASGYGITILEGDEPVYQRSEAAMNNGAAWTQEGDLSVGGAQWTFRLTPTDELLASIRSPLPTVILTGGVLMGALLAAAISLAGRSQARSIELAGTNKQLSDEAEARREADRKLRETNDELTQKNAEMEQFVYTVSHDLKSPIVTQIGFLGCIREDLAEGDYEQVLKSVDRLQRATRRMEQCIDDLLELSRIGRVRYEPEPVDIGALVREIRDNLSVSLNEANAVLEVQDGLPVILADRLRVTEVFENLITNAIKYGCPDDGGIISVDVQHHAEEVRFCVRDNGPGIPEEYREKVFGLFQRLDASKREGTGIGLAIVRRIMEQHGGRAWVESTESKGATFWITFPQSCICPTGGRSSQYEQVAV